LVGRSVGRSVGREKLLVEVSVPTSTDTAKWILAGVAMFLYSGED
jgi:hypothetical protein